MSKLVPSDGAAYDEFGYSVAISEDIVIVGAYMDDDQQGAAYLFERQGDGAWKELAKLTDLDGGAEDWFGFSVSLSGTGRALIGAWRDDEGGAERGSAHVFERQSDGSWLEVEKLRAADGASFDFFGYAVALSGDYAIVGARGEGGIFESGAAYIFERQGDGEWLEAQKLTPTNDPPFAWFGASVSINSEGRALVGSPGDWANGFGSGVVHVYERQKDGTWLHVETLEAADAEGDDRFGSSVSLDGDRVIVGAFNDDDNGTNSGSAYLFERQGDGTWLEVAKLIASDGLSFDQFGTSVSLSGDRSLVGANLNDSIGTDSGSAYLFERQSDDSWFETSELTATDGFPGDRFGVAVSISGDRAVVGAYWDDDLGTNSGSVYLVDDLILTTVEQSDSPAQAFSLLPPYPNPFRSSASLAFVLEERVHVRLVVYDMLGRQVRVLLDGRREVGTHKVVFDADGLPSGMYLYRLETSEGNSVETMLLAR